MSARLHLPNLHKTHNTRTHITHTDAHPDFMAFQALADECTPEERAENFKVGAEFEGLCDLMVVKRERCLPYLQRAGSCWAVLPLLLTDTNTLTLAHKLEHTLAHTLAHTLLITRRSRATRSWRSASKPKTSSCCAMLLTSTAR